MKADSRESLPRLSTVIRIFEDEGHPFVPYSIWPIHGGLIFGCLWITIKSFYWSGMKIITWQTCHMSDLEATRTDLEAGRNDRKRAIPHPRKQRRRSLWSNILLCFLGCGIARFLSLRAACLEVCAGCLKVLSRPASRSVFSVLGVFWPLRPKRALWHLITIK